MMESRTTTKGFAGRTRRNLEYLKNVYESQTLKEVHVVAHVVNSLLGIVIVPVEWGVHDGLRQRSLKELSKDRWPKWEITLDEPKGNKSKTETLGCLIWHLRNAAAHGRFQFLQDQDSPDLHKVEIMVEDRPHPSKPINWRARILASDLYEFCLRLAKAIDESK